MQGADAAAPLELTEELIQDPHTHYDRMRIEAPVREVVMRPGPKVWLVTRYTDARVALADPSLRKDMRQARDLFERHDTEDRTAGGFGREFAAHMLNSDPPDHTRLRRLVSKAFTARRVERLRPRIEQLTEELLADLAESDQVDLIDRFAFPLPVAVISELLGVPQHDRDEFRRWTTYLVSGGEVEAVTKAAKEMAAYLSELIASKRVSPADDLLTALTQVSDESDGDQLTEAELLSMAFLLLVAGHETTVNLIANGVLALLCHPDQLAALRADPAMLPGAVEEFLRYESPVNLTTMRYTVAPVRIGDVEIPAGEFVRVSLSAANRDGERFADAGRLDVTRADGGHLAFGHGIHFCLGAPLARLEGQIAIGQLLDRFPGLALSVGSEELRWRDSFVLRSLESLPVRLR